MGKMSITRIFLLLLGALMPHLSLANQSTSDCRGVLLGNQFPTLVSDLKEAMASGKISDKNTFFVLLPGNMGAHWANTNHNIGYDMLLGLIKSFSATGTKDQIQNYETPLETITFSARDLGDDTDLIDSQEFYSQKGYARTNSGEVFVSIGDKAQPTIVFLRRYGFYNDGGNFFVPAIREIGGRTENIIVIHDDLKAPLGQLVVEQGNAKYTGNRAILSVHNNLNAYRLSNEFVQNKEEIAHLLLDGLNSEIGKNAIGIEALFSEVERVIWRSVVEAKNHMDSIQLKSHLLKSLKSPFQDVFTQALKAIEPDVKAELEEINRLKSKIEDSSDKKVAAQIYRETRQRLANENQTLGDYYRIRESLQDVDSKKSVLLHSIFELFAESFDPRVMDRPFTRIGIGTGYDEWLQIGKANGFPPLPEGIDQSDFGGFPHFVLSKRNPSVFGDLMTQKIVELLESLTQ